ncbi:MAG: hypothetical protein L6Q98_05085 [Anaerolineae bacterium]|nr:hypothetical protein [Anaerolineae bacterium]NUQ05611.1 hypothetical protein [Anaerolineae bacterium]
MSVKLLMNWDIKPGRDQEYFEFVVREWVPGVQRLGLQPTGAWYTVYSRSKDTPQMLTEGIAKDLETMQDILASNDWTALHDRLTEFVHNYKQKIVHVTGGFQI